MSYKLRKMLDKEDVQVFLTRELRRIEVEMPKVSDGYVEEFFAEPVRSRGKLVLADGTSWNPGSGRGVYLWDGTIWRFLG